MDFGNAARTGPTRVYVFSGRRLLFVSLFQEKSLDTREGLFVP